MKIYTLKKKDDNNNFLSAVKQYNKIIKPQFENSKKEKFANWEIDNETSKTPDGKK